MDQFFEGQQVWVFYRFQQCQDVLYLPVANNQAGACSPRFGESDGWQQAIIRKVGGENNGPPIKDVVFVEYLHPLWFDRHGRKIYRERQIDMFQEWVHVSQLWDAKRGEPPRPDLSFLVVRWGGEEDCDPVSEGNGGWGRTGSNVSDPYMAVFFEETVWPLLGPTYQVITIFISNTQDLHRITPSFLAPLMKGKHKVAMFFLWPVTYQDAPLKQPGYVHSNALLDLMGRVEACGVVVRFPHHAHMYRLLSSKSWMAHLCLMPKLCVPATTKVSVSLIHHDPWQAAKTALTALRNVHICKNQLSPEQVSALPSALSSKGVVKLGFSWEAWGVKLFNGEAELGRQLASLAEQPLGLHDSVMVSEFVDFRVELRLFLVNPVVKWNPAKNKPHPVRPAKILYTKFDTVDGEKMLTNFNRLQRPEAIVQCFNGDEEAMTDAEKKASELAGRLLMWLQTETAEAPPVMRMDFMVQRVAPGVAKVTTGELTELGACFLGWEEGPATVWRAVLESCFRPSIRGDTRPKKLPEKCAYQIWRRIGLPWPTNQNHYAENGHAVKHNYDWHLQQQKDNWRFPPNRNYQSDHVSQPTVPPPPVVSQPAPSAMQVVKQAQPKPIHQQRTEQQQTEKPKHQQDPKAAVGQQGQTSLDSHAKKEKKSKKEKKEKKRNNDIAKAKKHKKLRAGGGSGTDNAHCE